MHIALMGEDDRASTIVITLRVTGQYVPDPTSRRTDPAGRYRRPAQIPHADPLLAHSRPG